MSEHNAKEFREGLISYIKDRLYILGKVRSRSNSTPTITPGVVAGLGYYLHGSCMVRMSKAQAHAELLILRISILRVKENKNLTLMLEDINELANAVECYARDFVAFGTLTDD